jgi:uncharacterized membrane protein
MRDNNQPFTLTTGRLEAFSDGVLAVFITLLLLTFADADKPLIESPEMSSSEVTAYLVGLWPHLLSFGLSFVLTAIYWILHHQIFHYIHKADRGLLWLNIIFLMCVALVSPVTDLLAERIGRNCTTLATLYGGVHCLSGLSLAAVWIYSCWGRRLIVADITPEKIRSITFSILFGPIMYLVSIAVSFINIPAGMLLYCVIPLFYVVPNHLDQVFAMTGLHRLAPQIPGAPATNAASGQQALPS